MKSLKTEKIKVMKNSIVYLVLFVLLFLLPVKNVKGKTFSEYLWSSEQVENTTLLIGNIQKITNVQVIKCNISKLSIVLYTKIKNDIIEVILK